MKKTIYVAVLGLVLLLILFLFLRADNSFSDTKNLSVVEVREYQGEKLSSVNDFRENSIKGVQYVNLTDYHLEVSGLVEEPKKYTYEEVIEKQSYEKVITLHCVEGWDATILWKGILVRDLLDEVKPSKEANTVILYAYDGYSTSFPIEYFYDNDILMAYEMNNATIIPARGFPFQLVAESKWGYKWIKWITKIELSSDANYTGYWESRGYSHTGNLSEGFLE